MATLSILSAVRKEQLLKWAMILAIITVSYNILEGLVSIFFGLEDETMALFGFGLDSFVEVISGVGIWHMLVRIKRNGEGSPDRFEQRALRMTGAAFYLLTAGLLATAALNLFYGHKPHSTLWGIIVSSISIVTMWLLIHFKMKVGKELNSQAIIADAQCTRTCLYLSCVLLAASIGFELTGIGGLDSAGTIVIAWFSFREGRESVEKAHGKACSCSGTCQ
jgi:divalent metal cation (Fe/Co/Zn/Cd) transporter